MSDEEHSVKLKLYWDEDKGEFIPESKESSSKAFVYLNLVEDNEQKFWFYFYTDGAPLIARRTALRAARGIAKTGYVNPKDGARYGVEYEFKEEHDQYEHLSDDLKKSQRSWYGGHYKKF